MKLTDAIARDLPFGLVIGSSHPLPVAWMWELREGGIAYVFSAGVDPRPPSHTCTGERRRARGRGACSTDRQNEDGAPLPTGAGAPVVAERGTEEEALRYFYFWHDKLPPDAVLSGTRNGK